MSPIDQPPTHALFVQWGKLKAGAFGVPAIVVLGLLILCAAGAYLWR